MWDILEICYVSFCDESLIQYADVIYVLKIVTLKIDPTLANFWKFSSKVRNPNGMMLLRKGILGNNENFIYAAGSLPVGICHHRRNKQGGTTRRRRRTKCSPMK